MNEQAHTPGPWKTNNDESVVVADTAKWTLVASCYGDDPQCRIDDRMRANARLIAQAPTMAAEIARLQDVTAALVLALRECEKRLRGFDGDPNYPRCNNAAECARAALRKAEGGEA